MTTYKELSTGIEFIVLSASEKFVTLEIYSFPNNNHTDGWHYVGDTKTEEIGDFATNYEKITTKEKKAEKLESFLNDVGEYLLSKWDTDLAARKLLNRYRELKHK